MSNPDKKEGVKSKRKIELEISEDLWKRIENQMNFLKEIKFPELSNIKTHEELIVFYIEQLFLPEDMKLEVNKKIDELLKIFGRKGMNMQNLFSGLGFETESKTTKNQEEQEPEEEDEIYDWVEENESESEE